MQIQVHTDHNIEGGDALAAWVSRLIDHTLERVAEHRTAVSHQW